jgi:hypothetical protein
LPTPPLRGHGGHPPGGLPFPGPGSFPAPGGRDGMPPVGVLAFPGSGGFPAPGGRDGPPPADGLASPSGGCPGSPAVWPPAPEGWPAPMDAPELPLSALSPLISLITMPAQPAQPPRRTLEPARELRAGGRSCWATRPLTNCVSTAHRSGHLVIPPSCWCLDAAQAGGPEPARQSTSRA